MLFWVRSSNRDVGVSGQHVFISCRYSGVIVMFNNPNCFLQIFKGPETIILLTMAAPNYYIGKRS